MSECPRLPQEVCDLIIDLLQDKPEILKQCSLVSKSWVSRPRKHLFSHVGIVREWDLSKWTRIFPDLANSPAYHTLTLSVDGAFGEAGKRSWVHAFSRVERLIVECGYLGLDIGYSLIPFRTLAPSLKSLCVNSIVGTPHSQVFGLIHSLPLLEDLTLRGNDMTIHDRGSDKPTTVLPPPTSPALTGTLELFLECMDRSLRLLMDVPGGLHFRKLTLHSSCDKKGFPLVAQLVAACSDTLESLDIACEVDGKYTHDPINLSTAKQLTDVAIRCELSSIKWVITTLRTITSKHLRRITIHLSGTPDRREGCPITDEVETVNSGMRWSDLDRLLVQFSKSHSIRSQVLYPRTRFGTKEVKDWVGQMLQESSRRGVVDLVGVSCVSRLQPVRRIVDAIRDQNCDVQT